MILKLKRRQKQILAYSFSLFVNSIISAFAGVGIFVLAIRSSGYEWLAWTLFWSFGFSSMVMFLLCIGLFEVDNKK